MESQDRFTEDTPLLIPGGPNVNGKWCFQKTLIFAFQYGRIQTEHVGVNGVY
jgi:hypothetical protein